MELNGIMKKIIREEFGDTGLARVEARLLPLTFEDVLKEELERFGQVDGVFVETDENQDQRVRVRGEDNFLLPDTDQDLI
jgi:hypothetical protein